jgi:hypothetical protein
MAFGGEVNNGAGPRIAQQIGNQTPVANVSLYKLVLGI